MYTAVILVNFEPIQDLETECLSATVSRMCSFEFRKSQANHEQAGRSTQTDTKNCLDHFINPLNPNGNCMSHLLQQSINNSSFCIYGFHMILTANSDYFLESVNQLIFVMVKCGVFFAVRTEFLNII
jgi:hypothetical protein